MNWKPQELQEPWNWEPSIDVSILTGQKLQMIQVDLSVGIWKNSNGLLTKDT